MSTLEESLMKILLISKKYFFGFCVCRHCEYPDKVHGQIHNDPVGYLLLCLLISVHVPSLVSTFIVLTLKLILPKVFHVLRLSDCPTKRSMNQKNASDPHSKTRAFPFPLRNGSS